MLLDEVRARFNQARKNKDDVAKSAIEAVLAAVLLKQKSGKGELTDNDVIECVSKEIKVQKEIEELYKEKDTATSTLASGKIEVLKEFLPKQLTEEEVLAIIKEKDVYEDASPKTKGMIIKSIMPLLVGKFDKSKVNGLVEEYLKNKMLIELLKEFNIDFCAVFEEKYTDIVFMLPYKPFESYPKNCAKIDAFYIASNNLYQKVKEIKQVLLQKGFAIVERELNLKQLAEKGGLGSRLNNQLLANNIYGTKITLQGFSVQGNYQYLANGAVEKNCDLCGLCDKACPTNSLNCGKFTRESCIRHKQDFSEKYYPEVFGRTLGCEECQKVCPHNAKIKAVKMPQEVQKVFNYDNIFKMLTQGKKGLQPLAALIGSNYARVSYIFNLVVNSLISSDNFNYSEQIIAFKNHTSDLIKNKVAEYVQLYEARL